MDLALTNRYEVELVCFEFDNWTYELNERLKEKFSRVRMHIIPAGRKKFIPWVVSVIKEKSFRQLSRLFKLPLPALSQAVSRRSQMIIRELKHIENADWVIGHNPGALFPALVAAKKFNCRAGFDVEDYHPGEGQNTFLQGLSKRMMVTVLPQMNYVSFASPLIMKAVENDMKGRVHGDWFTVLNYFPATEFEETTQLEEGPVKMVWFSQNINSGRGLELVLPFIKREPLLIELHLIGNPALAFYDAYLKGFPNIICHPPMKQEDLHKMLSGFDVGLALDIATDTNRDLVITNKLLAYLQAGLFVLATNTAAQQSFLHEFPGNGCCFDYTKNDLTPVMDNIIAGIERIRSEKITRYNNFKNHHWEATSMRLLKAWNTIA